MTSITSLPSDIIIDNIIPLLTVQEFLNFSATCRAFHSLAYDEVYWRKLTTSTFRLPAQPLRDRGWRELYKNLSSATLFTWGSNDKGRLGHNRTFYKVPFPLEVDLPLNEVAADVTMGGWSTTVLTASGSLYTWGTLSGSLPSYPVQYRVTSEQASKLEFPQAYSSSKILEVSSGRDHVLGLSEEGRVWLWRWENRAGRYITFTNEEMRRYGSNYYGSSRTHGTVEKVAAGWNHSAVLINGIGIVVWFDKPNDFLDQNESFLVSGERVPGTCYIEGTTKPATICDEDWEYAKEVGEVTHIMAGDSYLVFLTKSGKVYAITAQPDMVGGIRPVQLQHFTAPEGEKPMTYLSGAFTKFAVFNADGLVYIGTKDMVQQALGVSTNGSSHTAILEDGVKPIVMPSLQKRGIVAIAFGDYHTLALTGEGKILTWGTESMKCGCLGLGPMEVARKKGVKYTYDGNLEEPAEVDLDWFETNPQYHSQPYEEKKSEYFVFNISAAGWHSGALALVPDKESRERSRRDRVAATQGIKPSQSSQSADFEPTRVRPHPPHQQFRVPGSSGRPPGEAGHGGILRPGDEPIRRGVIGDIISSNPSPFISHGPVRPAPGAFPTPTPMTGGALQMGEDDRRRYEEEQTRRES